MTTRGLLVGRFQPPHLGHLALIKHVLNEVDELIIAVAAAQISHTKKNPLKAGERVMMLRKMLQNNDLDPDSYWIIPTQDIMDNSLWVPHLQRLLPKFDVFFGNNPFTKMLFEEHGIETRQTPMFNREAFEASRIRQLLIEEKSVAEHIDDDVAGMLKEINISRRFKSIINDDSEFKEKSKPGSELQNM